MVLNSEGNERKILHANGRVRIDTLDQQGIFNAEEGRHTHQLSGIRRVG
jgi:hypothetical protein